MCSTEAGRRGLVPATYIRITKSKPREDPFAVTDDPFGADDPFAGVFAPLSSFSTADFPCNIRKHYLQTCFRLPA